MEHLYLLYKCVCRYKFKVNIILNESLKYFNFILKKRLRINKFIKVSYCHIKKTETDSRVVGIPSNPTKPAKCIYFL